MVARALGDKERQASHFRMYRSIAMKDDIFVLLRPVLLELEVMGSRHMGGKKGGPLHAYPPEGSICQRPRKLP